MVLRKGAIQHVKNVGLWFHWINFRKRWFLALGHVPTVMVGLGSPEAAQTLTLSRTGFWARHLGYSCYFFAGIQKTPNGTLAAYQLYDATRLPALNAALKDCQFPGHTLDEVMTLIETEMGLDGFNFS